MPNIKSNTVKVLQVFGALGIGGVPIWLLEMIRNMNREIFKFDFLVYTDEPKALDAEFKSLGANIFPCPYLSRPWVFARSFKKLYWKMALMMWSMPTPAILMAGY